MGRNKCVSLDIVRTGERIRNTMIKNGYSVRELQEILNLSCPQPIYRWMKGYMLPSVDNLYVMHQIFKVHMEDLLVGSEMENTEDV